MDDLRIGDFSRPVVPPVSVSPAAPPGTSLGASKDILDDKDARLTDAVKAVEAELKPMASYEEQLREVGLDKAKAAEIVDAILTRGYWAEDVSITKSVKARFRTRSSKDRSRAVSFIETARPMYDSHYQELLSKLLLAASLESFASDKFDHPDLRSAKADDIEAAFNARFRYVDSVISDPAFILLTRHFTKFDNKIRVVMQEGAVENF
jgi:hypothetical protein